MDNYLDKVFICKMNREKDDFELYVRSIHLSVRNREATRKHILKSASEKPDYVWFADEEPPKEFLDCVERHRHDHTNGN